MLRIANIPSSVKQSKLLVVSRRFVTRSKAMAQDSPLCALGGRITKKEEVKNVYQRLLKVIKEKNCAPIMVRLAWHDSGTYDKNISSFPERGGANGSIRFYPEIGHGANAGLINALQLLKDIAEEFKDISYADLFQLASAVGIEVAGGPKMPLRLGRKDACGPEQCAPEGNLPAGEGSQGWPKGATCAASHLRDVFHRMGFTDQEIVALSGAHTLGRAKPTRSGFGKDKTKYTENGPGVPGGSSWTPEWLKFDNSYFKVTKDASDPELLTLDTDQALFKDEKFRPYAEKYAADEKLFFEDYTKAHLKLSELGSEWNSQFTLTEL